MKARESFGATNCTFIRCATLKETDSHYVMNVDLPGVSSKDINIKVKNNELHISGERKSENKNKGNIRAVSWQVRSVIAFLRELIRIRFRAQCKDRGFDYRAPQS